MDAPKEHEFAPYIRIIGKGPRSARPLTREEADAAMCLILDGRVESAQLGAFFMLLRLRSETPEELAGFVAAARARIAPAGVVPDLDWPSYAGKRRRLPWFLLAALLLAESGVRVLLHGGDAQTGGRLYAGTALAALGVQPCRSLSEAEAQLVEHNFAYLPLAAFSPRFQEIINLRPLLGLRSSMHTVVRLLNPMRAPHSIQGVFHPGYRTRHQKAAVLLGDPHIAVLKGEGGEFERDPSASATLYTVDQNLTAEQIWPAFFNGPRQVKDPVLDPARLAALWRGESEDEYAEAAIIGTAALALARLGRAANQDAAHDEAARLWQQRGKGRRAPSVN